MLEDVAPGHYGPGVISRASAELLGRSTSEGEPVLLGEHGGWWRLCQCQSQSQRQSQTQSQTRRQRQVRQRLVRMKK